MDKIFFDSWDSILRTALITIMSYVLLVVLLRGFGKRTLSKMNAFDMVITVALGSTLASVILTKDITLADAATAFILLIGLQFLITYTSVRNKQFSHLIKSKPTLLVYKGEMLTHFMRKERIAEDEILAIVREKGFGSLDEADAVVLETDGSMTVIGSLPKDDAGAIRSLDMPDGLNKKLSKPDEDRRINFKHR